MVYEIVGVSQLGALNDVDGVYDNPKAAKCDLDSLRKQFPGADLAVAKDGVKLSEAELDAAIESYDIQAVREKESRLPATYRHGRGTEKDDVATDADGNPTKVWGPDNPDNRYD